MTDPVKYERLYKDDRITNEPNYDDPIEQETPEEYQSAQDASIWFGEGLPTEDENGNYSDPTDEDI